MQHKEMEYKGKLRDRDNKKRNIRYLRKISMRKKKEEGRGSIQRERGYFFLNC